MKLIISTLAAAIAGGALVWFFTSRGHEEPAPSTAGKPAPANASPSPSSTPSGLRPQPAPEGPSDADRAVADLKDQVVVSLGKIEDIGKQTAIVMLAKRELKDLKGIQIPDRTPEQRRRIQELERQRADVLGMLPEVAGFQNNAAEYSRFFAGMLQQAAGLDPAQTKSVSDYMQARGEAMISAGLNAAREPTDSQQQETWEIRRDAFNAETVTGAAALLPPGVADRIGFNTPFMELLERDFDKAEE